MNSTRLDKTYLNDKVSTRDFYTTYRNNKNKIEDPIITGFTFDIDILHSPLFFALAADEYNESLRSSGGTDTSLAFKIESKLEDVYKFHIASTPDSYEINTLKAKDEIGDRKAGYGLQEKYYIDNVLYGAVDYIYMVDKVAVSTYTDKFGVTDVGNGTITNTYQQMGNTISGVQKEFDKNSDIQKYSKDDARKKAMMDGTYSAEFDYDEETGEEILVSEQFDMSVSSQIEGKKMSLEKSKEGYKEQHKKNNKLVKDLQTQYDNIVNGEYKTAKKDLEDLQGNIDKAKTDCGSNLLSHQDNANRFKNQLIGTGDKTSVKNDISLSESNFNNWFSTEVKNNKYLNVNYKEPSESDIASEISKLNLSDNTYKSYFEICFKIIGFKLLDRSVKTEYNTKIEDYKNKIKRFENELYGTHKDGRIGTEYDPAEGSLYDKLNKAKNQLQNDEYSQTEDKINELTYTESNLKDIEKYQNEYANNKQQTERNDLSGSKSPYADNVGGYSDASANSSFDNMRKTIDMFEVPQTVYDMMGFINGMNDIITKYPYILQTISGLDEAYKKYFEVKDPYMGSGDGTISIDCLEMLDLRVSSMFNKYFNAVYDRQYRRERVPVNLRRFNCSVFVHDIRNFKDAISGNINHDLGDLTPIVMMALNYVSAIEFKFYDCEIVPEETGGVFDMVSNIADSGDTVKTKFTFKYGNCVINFLPFEDLRKYLFNSADIEPKKYTGKDSKRSGTWFDTVGDYESRLEKVGPDGNFRRWYDRSELGNVNNNDYREYIRHDAYVAVDDHYKTSIVNNFALNSVSSTNKRMTETEDALRRIIIGISASTGLPVGKVTDALNVGYLNSVLTEKDLATPIVRNIGNVNNSRIIDTKTTEYIGTVIGDNQQGDNQQGEKIVDDLGNVNSDGK